MKTAFFRVAMISTLSLLFGCGTGEYERRLAEGSADVQKNSKFAVLGSPTTIPGTQMSLQFPSVMQSFDITGDPQRGKCPVLDLQGLKATYEGTVKDDKGNDMHFYMYVAASEVKYSPAQNWLGELQQKFPKAEAFNSTGVNQNYSVQSPEGLSLSWEEIHFKCDQNFYYPTKENPQNFMTTSGILVCLCHIDNGICTSLFFRFPSNLESRHEADFDSDWIKLVAGTLKVEAAQ
jgi:hypothetical protein